MCFLLLIIYLLVLTCEMIRQSQRLKNKKEIADRLRVSFSIHSFNDLLECRKVTQKAKKLHDFEKVMQEKH